MFKIFQEITVSLVILIVCSNVFGQNSQNSPRQCLESSIKRSSAIIVGEVERADLKPGYFSQGVFESNRVVKYRIKKVLSGNLNSNELWIIFPLVKDMSYLEENALSSQIFQEHNEHILVIEKTLRVSSSSIKIKKKDKDKIYFPSYLDCGFLVFNQDNSNLIDKILKKQPL